jgi:hypothetical protein
MFYGYLGWVVVALKTSPATLLVPLDAEERVKIHLEKCGFIKVAGEERWVPPLPRALRWPRNKVDLKREDGALTLRGAANYLKAIARDLRMQGDTLPVR